MRLSNQTNMFQLERFLNETWKLLDPVPDLIISIIGTTAKTDLIDKLVEGIKKVIFFFNLAFVLWAQLFKELLA